MNALANISKVLEVEALMKLAPQVEILTKHHFSKDVYAREIHIPKDTMLTGHIHKFENLNILAKGRIRVSTTGDKYQELEAPAVIVSPPGTKRIAYALEDCVWITVHGTDEKNIDLIDKKFIAHGEIEYLDFVGNEQLALPGF